MNNGSKEGVIVHSDIDDSLTQAHPHVIMVRFLLDFNKRRRQRFPLNANGQAWFPRIAKSKIARNRGPAGGLAGSMCATMMRTTTTEIHSKRPSADFWDYGKC